MNTEKGINQLVDDYTEAMDALKYIQKNTKFVLNKWVVWMVTNKINITEPRRADIVKYKQYLIDKSYTPSTINRYLAPVRCFFRYLENNGIYSDIASGIKSPKDEREYIKDYLNPEQVIKLLSLIERNTLIGKRDYAMINLMFCTGLRRVEIHRLKVMDLMVNKDYVLTIRRKGKVSTEQIKIDAEIFDPIHEYLVNRNPYKQSDPLFANHSRHPHETISSKMISSIVKNYLKKLNVNTSRLTCHSLRHSAAINLLQSGKSIYDVRDLLGHKSVETTQIYLRAIESIRKYNNNSSSLLIKLYSNKPEIALVEPKNELINV